MGIHINDLPQDLDPGHLSTIQGGSWSHGFHQPSTNMFIVEVEGLT